MRRVRALSICLAPALALGCPASDEPEPEAAATSEASEEESPEPTPEPPTPEPPTPDPSTTTGDDSDGSSSEGGESSSSGVEGGCPYDDPGWEYFVVGQEIPHWEFTDHAGEPWSACDHYDKPMFVDTSAAWCQPCQLLAAYMAGDDAAGELWISDPTFLNDYLRVIREYVNNGCVTWVTVLTQSTTGAPATDGDAAAWDASYPNENIPVIADPTGDFENYLQITAFPSGYLVNNNFKWLSDDLVTGMQLIVDNLECIPEEEEE